MGNMGVLFEAAHANELDKEEAQEDQNSPLHFNLILLLHIPGLNCKCIDIIGIKCLPIATIFS